MSITMHTDTEIIDALGGTAAVARLCQVKKPSVSEWRKKGIPSARRMYLEAVRPDVFVSLPEHQDKAISETTQHEAA